MGFLANLLFVKTKIGETIEDKDENCRRVADQIFAKKFATVTDGDIEDALDKTRSVNDPKTFLSELDVEKKYTASTRNTNKKQNKDALVALLTKIVAKLKEPTDKILVPVALKTGGLITGKESGTIGGFLINKNKDVFLFSNAHVLVKVLSKPCGKNTTDRETKDPVCIGKTQVGAVVCSCSIGKGKWPNYDIALAKVDPEYYSRINLAYDGTTQEKKHRRYLIDKIDYNLCEGKSVFLFGDSSGVKEGKLKKVTYQNYETAAYKNKQGTIQLDHTIVVEKANNIGAYSLTLEGDSGGLWVSNEGAVGLQILGGVGTNEAWIHPMYAVMDYFKKMYDGSLRFLQESDLNQLMPESK